MLVEDYQRILAAELGSFVGPLIDGIYEGIQRGSMDVRSEFAEIVGRPHHSPPEMIRAFVASRDVKGAGRPQSS